MYEDGKCQIWYQHGVVHREDGPAVMCNGGYQAWYLHGKHHREDGPAVVYGDGDQSWYLHGMLVKKEQNYYEQRFL